MTRSRGLTAALAVAALAGSTIAAEAVVSRPDATIAKKAKNRKPVSLRAVGVSASRARADGRALTLKLGARRKAKLTLTVLDGKRKVAKARKTVKRSRRSRAVTARLSAAVAGSGLKLRIVAKVGKRRGRGTIALATTAPTPAPSPTAAPTPSATPATPAPTVTPGPVDPYAGGLCPQRRFPEDLTAMVNALPPQGDPDGDGFTTERELVDFNFDPRNDPARFSPLVADVPRIETEVGAMSVALLDQISSTETEELGTVNVDTTGSTQSRTDSESESNTNSMTISIETGYENNSAVAKTKFEYTNSTTNENSVSIGAEQRKEQSEQVSAIQSANQGRTIDSGTLAVETKIHNPGHVSYKVLSMRLLVRARDVATGELVPYGQAAPKWTPAQAPTLGPGETSSQIFELEGIGASDSLALLEDAGFLRFEITDVKLTAIGAEGYQVDSSDFDQYTDTVTANTAAVAVDFADGEPTRSHLVSTSFLRNVDGSAAGTSLCDALTLVLGREPKLGEVTYPGSAEKQQGIVALKADDGSTVSADPAENQLWITAVTPQSVGSADVFGAEDVLLRPGHAGRLVLFADKDSDGVERRLEQSLGSSDSNTNSDGDGLTDNFEVLVGWDVDTERHGVAAPPSVAHAPVRHTFSDPSSPDTEGDGRRDGMEKDLKLDPLDPDTDADGAADGPDPFPHVVSALARYDFDAPFPALGGGWIAIPDAIGGPGLATCQSGARGPIADRTGAADKAFNSVHVTNEPCEIASRSWPLGNEFTIAGWIRIPEVGENGLSKTWLAGVPGGLALELEVRRPYERAMDLGEWHTGFRITNGGCDGSAACGPPPPPTSNTGFPGTNGHLSIIWWGPQGGHPEPGSWHFVAMSTFQTVFNGQAGTHMILQVDDRVNARFIPQTWAGGQGCQMVVGSITHTCAGNRFPAPPTVQYWVSVDPSCPACPSQERVTYEATTGTAVDGLHVVRSAMDIDRMSRIRDFGF